MRKPRNIARLFSLALTLGSLISWNILPIHSSGRVVRAATRVGHTFLSGGSAQTAVATSKIAFSTDSEIYTMNPDGSDLQRLTFDPQPNFNPAWSPDGSRIAFVKLNGPDWHGEIYVMNADGSNQTRLTTSRNDDFPAWSPDGTKIAFSQAFGSPTGRASYVMNADGTDLRAIDGGYQPSWSPDGAKLALTDGTVIYSINADGSGRTTQITSPRFGNAGADWDLAPAWSPDGARIAFTRFLSCVSSWDGDYCQASEVWVVNADGSGGRRLEGFPNSLSFPEDPAPSWSPDGATIVFSTTGDLFLIAADGTGITNITNTVDTNESHPSWPRLLSGCASSVSPMGQSFEVNGGTGSVDVSAGGECGWTASSNASWISITSGSGSGNGRVIYSVAANTGTDSRTAGLIVASHIVNVTQSGVPVRIVSASVEGKRLFVVGENFDPGAVILLNSEEQNTRNDPQNPRTTLIGRKAGKKIKSGDRLQVRNPNGSLSQAFILASL